MTSTIVAIAEHALQPFKTNGNTGNKYEIVVNVYFLGKMGLDNTSLDPSFFMDIHRKNPHANIDDLRSRFLTHTPDSTDCVIDGKHVVGLRNATQKDEDGKTGDLILIVDTGEEYSVSVCEGKPRKNGRIEKVLTNAAAKRFGVTDMGIKWIKAIEADAVLKYKAEMGPDESTWKNRKKTKAAKHACTRVAKHVADRFATFPLEKRIGICKDILRLDNVSNRPADYLALVDKHTMCPTFYKFNDCSMTEWNPIMTADGIYLHINNGDVPLGKVQVKFNYGVYHKGKSSSLSSSWNVTIYMSDIFSLPRIHL